MALPIKKVLRKCSIPSPPPAKVGTPFPFFQFPSDVQGEIFSFCSLYDLISFRQVCRESRSSNKLLLAIRKHSKEEVLSQTLELLSLPKFFLADTFRNAFQTWKTFPLLNTFLNRAESKRYLREIGETSWAKNIYIVKTFNSHDDLQLPVSKNGYYYIHNTFSYQIQVIVTPFGSMTTDEMISGPKPETSIKKFLQQADKVSFLLEGYTWVNLLRNGKLDAKKISEFMALKPELYSYLPEILSSQDMMWKFYFFLSNRYNISNFSQAKNTIGGCIVAHFLPIYICNCFFHSPEEDFFTALNFFLLILCRYPYSEVLRNLLYLLTFFREQKKYQFLDTFTDDVLENIENYVLPGMNQNNFEHDILTLLRANLLRIHMQELIISHLRSKFS